MLYCNTATVAATRPLGRCDTALGARMAGRTGARCWTDRALGAGARGKRAAGGRERADARACGRRAGGRVGAW